MIPIAFGVTAVLAKMAVVAVIPKLMKALRPTPNEPPPATLKTPDPKTGLPPNSPGHHSTDYGETRQTSGSTALYNPFLYTGQEYDTETGLYHLRARHYSPDKGRFFARDPIRYAGGSNMYAYCAGDPIGCIDPSGTEVIVYTNSPGGSQVRHTFNTVSELINFVAPIDSQVIDRVFFRGHGSRRSQGFDLADRSDNVHQIVYELGDVYLKDAGGVNFGKLSNYLAGKFDPQGSNLVTLIGCDTAGGTDNITRAVSKSLPGITVVGSAWAGFSVGAQNFFLIPPGQKIYRNGVRQ